MKGFYHIPQLRPIFTGIALLVVSPAVFAQDNHLSQQYYKRFTGTVAGQPVTAYIQRTGSEVTAWYAYNRHREPIGLYYTPAADADSLLFLEGDTTMETGKQFPGWKCRFENGRLTGTWTNARQTKNYPIKLKEDYSGGAYAFDVHTYNKVFDAFPGKDSTPQYEITAVYLTASGNGDAATWLNEEIKTFMGWKDGASIDAGLKAQVKEYVANYRDNMEGLKEEPYNASMNWENTQQLSVAYNGNGYVVLQDNLSEYSGGAHGNYAVDYDCFDVQQQKRMRLSDIVSADSATLRGLLEAQFREDYGLGSTDSLGKILLEDRLPPNSNFYFTDKGLGFAYSPYEVAAYAEGEITVLIPYEKLKRYLDPVFTDRMKLLTGKK
ncbi:hypothetical protein A8C56_20985 [Niabella ginsenosidivorans]|uniref:DUF3298 domain-containing protein n=1 Tax=Niabella ginsenosidivorans TaxID=1176587 RepID=A0A1A9I9C2_9BACT|nr:DUF3298 and DUF4163 domain-containing protein [Niabella ginsenosidivorans]ANH83124.1 hypothetical protein A8C56_20985 [Niabella ginsenosidivorans]